MQQSRQGLTVYARLLRCRTFSSSAAAAGVEAVSVCQSAWVPNHFVIAVGVFHTSPECTCSLK